jgi:hypothetical protein
MGFHEHLRLIQVARDHTGDLYKLFLADVLDFQGERLLVKLLAPNVVLVASHKATHGHAMTPLTDTILGPFVDARLEGAKSTRGGAWSLLYAE